MTDHEPNEAQPRQEIAKDGKQPHETASRDALSGPMDNRSNTLASATAGAFAVDEKHIDEKRESSGSDEEQGETPEGREPNDFEKETLQHVGESLPFSAFLVAFVELCERFTFYGCSGIFQNYVQRPLDGSLGRGALGMGHVGATGLTTFFNFALNRCYVTPIIGAIVADQYLGKYKTIMMFCLVYMSGLLILFATSLPTSLHHGAGLGGFITAVLVIGLGTGGIKSNIAPLIADQYRIRRMAIARNPKTGERIILDPAVTIQRIYMIFYLCINVGSLSLIATPYVDRDVGYWSAYLLCFCMFCAGFAILVLARKKYVVRPPQGSVITDAFKALGLMIRYRNRDAPKQSWLSEHGKNKNVMWEDHFVDELKRALVACSVFTIYPIYWVVYGQFNNNFVGQAGEMAGHGMPNDLAQDFDPISIIVFVPILDRLAYPLLRKNKIPFPPISRIVTGFCVASLAMAYAAIVQHLIYTHGPCYYHPFCDASVDENGVARGNNVHIAVQIPAYMLIGISEIFASVTGLDYAYTKAPPSMKSFVQSMFLLTNAFGSAIGEGLSPLAVDPKIMWMFTGLAVASFLAGIFIYLVFGRLNKTEDAMNALDQDVTDADVTGHADDSYRRGSKVTY